MPGLTCPCSICDFNPLPPHGGRPNLRCTARNMRAFQSTPSAWRETCTSTYLRCNRRISIHSLRMEGDLPQTWRTGQSGISIHSLRMEGDHSSVQSDTARYISIHSLRMEGDYHRLSTLPLQCYFNPLPPHGGRLSVITS